MKKLLLLSLVLSTLVSCSSSKSKKISMDDLAIENASKEDVIIGKELPSWVRKSGSDGQYVFAVGSAEFPLNKSQSYIVSAATFDAKNKVIQDAPAEYKSIVQRAIGETLGANGDFNQIQTSVSEAKGMVGIRTDDSKVTCRKIKRYLASGTNVNRVCYVYAYAKVTNINAAYARVMKDKYGEERSDRFKEILDSQVKSMIK